MGVYTKLFIKNDISAFGLETIIKSLPNVKSVTFGATHTHDYALIDVCFDEKVGNWNNGDEVKSRQISFHRCIDTPIGTAQLLSLRHNDHAVAFLTSIAKRIGGILQEADCEEKYTFIDGINRPDDGLAYHLNKALTHGEMRNNEDLTGFIQYMRKQD